jgi:outer membrane protein OmpA-like peptidoglycan-associated protein
MSMPVPFRLSIAAVVLGALLATSGCSWFRRDEATQPPGADRPAPSVGRVPDKAPQTGTTRERLAIEQGLMADRENARHVDGPVAAEERQSSLPAGPDVRPQVITPGAPAPAAAEGNRRGAAEPARPAAPRSIVFVSGSAALPTGSGASVVALAEAHRRAGGGLVSVVGNAAAAEGDAAARRALAQARVQAVIGALINLGVPREAIRGGVGNVDAPRVDLGFVPRR